MWVNVRGPELNAVTDEYLIQSHVKETKSYLKKINMALIDHCQVLRELTADVFQGDSRSDVTARFHFQHRPSCGCEGVKAS